MHSNYLGFRHIGGAITELGHGQKRSQEKEGKGGSLREYSKSFAIRVE